ncbi:hypothetical protein D3C73_1060230 [compost metagenome]
MPLSAMADGRALTGTCSETEACQAGPKTAIPLPTMKQKASRASGVSSPSIVTAHRPTAPASAKDSAPMQTKRRSNISEMAPAGRAMSIMGAIRAVWTSATIMASSVNRLMLQAAPTPWIRMPKLDKRLADQILRNTGTPNGARRPSARSVIAHFPHPDHVITPECRASWPPSAFMIRPET